MPIGEVAGAVDTRIAPPSVTLSRPELLRQAAFIGGKWVAGNEHLAVVDPATGARLGNVPALGADEAGKAVAAAYAAFPEWSGRPAPDRANFLKRWHELIMAHRDDLARLLTAEQGKPLHEAKGEVAYAAAFIEWYAEEARRIGGEVLTPHVADKRLLIQRKAVGVVAAITPWNFPLAMVTRKLAPAFAAGCTAILKPSELTPFSALALAYLAEEAGLPAGVLNVVTGPPSPIGEVLTGDVRIRKLTFTGSTAIGKMLAARAMATVKRVSLELGGNAPFIVFADADLDVAIDAAIAAKFRNTGQTCVCANRFLVHRSIQTGFATRLAERVARLVVGPGLAGATDQGPLIDDRAVAKVEAHVADALEGGGTLLTGGARHAAGGRFFTPTVISDVAPDALLCREETFGPIAGIVAFDDDEEAIALANDTASGLAAYVFTRDMDRAWRLPERLEYGMVGMNTGLISTEIAPFGGVKESGLGREGSRHGLDEYLDLQLVCHGLRPERA